MIGLCPAHADAGELLAPVLRQRRGPAALVADPCTEPELSLLLVLAAAAPPVAADDDPFDVLPEYAQVPLTFEGLAGPPKDCSRP